jgi:hypothetical protein
MQVQSRLLDEQAFRDTVAVLQASQARLRTQARAQLASRLNQSMHQCLILSRARTARLRRMARLKKTLENQRGFAGADPQLMLHHAVLLSPRRGSQQDAGGSDNTFVGDVRRPDAQVVSEGGGAIGRTEAASAGIADQPSTASALEGHASDAGSGGHAALHYARMTAGS